MVEYSTEYTYQLGITGVSDTRKGANDLRNQFLDLLKDLRKKKGKRFCIQGR